MKNLKKRMDSVGVTTYRLARLSGVNRATIGRWLKGTQKPTLENWLKVDEALRKLE